MLSRNKKTLAYQTQARPLYLSRDLSNTPIYLWTKTLRSNFSLDKDMPKPEIMGVEFYYANHIMSIIRQKYEPHEELPLAVLNLVEDFNASLVKHAGRMVYYMYLICVREARYYSKYKDHLSEYMIKNFPNFHKFAEKNQNSNQSTSIDMTVNVSIDGLTIGEMMQGNEKIFSKGHWQGSYGGPKWAKINKCLNQFIFGDINAETLMDNAFNLAHNTGPIFNKGMLIAHHNASSTLITLLDLQRAGQIPLLVDNEEDTGKYNLHPFVSTKVKKWHSLVKEILGTDGITGYVDWIKVESCNSLQKYPTYKDYQKKKYGDVKPPPVALGKGKEFRYNLDLITGGVVPVYTRKKAV